MEYVKTTTKYGLNMSDTQASPTPERPNSTTCIANDQGHPSTWPASMPNLAHMLRPNHLLPTPSSQTIRTTLQPTDHAHATMHMQVPPMPCNTQQVTYAQPHATPSSPFPMHPHTLQSQPRTSGPPLNPLNKPLLGTHQPWPSLRNRPVAHQPNSACTNPTNQLLWHKLEAHAWQPTFITSPLTDHLNSIKTMPQHHHNS